MHATLRGERSRCDSPEAQVTTDVNAAVQRYLDALRSNYEALNEAATRAADRGVTVGRRFLDDVATGQTEASDLAQRLNGKPEQVALAQASIMAATMAAQARALSFTQLVTDQSTAAQGESQELLEKIASTTRECSEAAAALMQAWTSMNPLAEMAQRSMAAWGKQS
jgi:hypothetical protein